MKEAKPEKTEYIHYGSSTFDPKLLTPSGYYEHNSYKPFGLWASRVNTELNWHDWCMNEDFHVERLASYFKFVLAEGARVLNIHELTDAEEYLHIRKGLGRGSNFSPVSWNYPKLYKEFDAVELQHGDNYEQLHGSYIFYGWDVDSIVIWNPDIVVPIHEKGVLK